MVRNAVRVLIIKLLKFGVLKAFIQMKKMNSHHAQLVHQAIIAQKVR